jgi:hypothetical protein
MAMSAGCEINGRLGDGRARKRSLVVMVLARPAAVMRRRRLVVVAVRVFV